MKLIQNYMLNEIKKPKKHMVKENLKSNFALCILLPLIAAENFF